MTTNEQTNDSVIPSANTPSEINIHLGYIRRDILNMQTQSAKDMKELKDQITELDNNFVTEKEFRPVAEQTIQNATDIKDLTESRDTLNGKLIGFAAASGVFSSVITLLISHFWK